MKNFLSKTLGLGAATIMLAASSLAFADQKPHPYIGFSLGSADYDTLNESDSSLNFRGGYYVNQNLQLEAAYHDLGGGTGFDASAISLSVLGALPITDTFSLYAKAGFASGEIEFDGGSLSETDFTFGVGGSLGVAEQISIVFDLQKIKVGEDSSISEQEDVLNSTIGVNIRF